MELPIVPIFNLSKITGCDIPLNFLGYFSNFQDEILDYLHHIHFSYQEKKFKIPEKYIFEDLYNTFYNKDGKDFSHIYLNDQVDEDIKKSIDNFTKELGISWNTLDVIEYCSHSDRKIKITTCDWPDFQINGNLFLIFAFFEASGLSNEIQEEE